MANTTQRNNQPQNRATEKLQATASSIQGIAWNKKEAFRKGGLITVEEKGAG
jgi:hypothetical protein